MKCHPGLLINSRTMDIGKAPDVRGRTVTHAPMPVEKIKKGSARKTGFTLKRQKERQVRAGSRTCAAPTLRAQEEVRVLTLEVAAWLSTTTSERTARCADDSVLR